MAKHRRGEKDPLTTWKDDNPLRQWRLNQPPEGWNRSVLARRLGVSHTAVGSWETGKRRPKVDRFAKIEALTGITTKAWMDWYERRPTKA